MKKSTIIEIAWDLESDLRSLQTNAKRLNDSIINFLELNYFDEKLKELADCLNELANFDLYDFIVNADDDLNRE